MRFAVAVALSLVACTDTQETIPVELDKSTYAAGDEITWTLDEQQRCLFDDESNCWTSLQVSAVRGALTLMDDRVFATEPGRGTIQFRASYREETLGTHYQKVFDERSVTVR